MCCCNMSKTQSPIRSFLAEHPKWIGVLFTTFVLLTQAGMGAAGNATTTVGP